MMEEFNISEEESGVTDDEQHNEESNETHMVFSE